MTIWCPGNVWEPRNLGIQGVDVDIIFQLVEIRDEMCREAETLSRVFFRANYAVDVSCIEDFIWHVGDIGYMDDSYAHSPVRLYGIWAGGTVVVRQ